MAYAPRIRLQPSLTLDEETAANAVAILKEVFELCVREKLVAALMERFVRARSQRSGRA